jgi:hypothetical protein
MSEPSLIVEVPGVPRFSGALRPAERCVIPLEVRARLGPLGLLTLVNGLFGVIALVVAGLSLSEPSVIQTYHFMIVMTLVFGVFLTLPAATLLFDRLRPQPLVYIGRDSFYDARSLRQPIAWTDVSHAAVIYRGRNVRRAPHEPAIEAFGFTLTLRHAIAAHHNRFRLGAFGFKWRRYPNEIYVSLLQLSQKPHALADTMLALVQRHGSIIER